MSNNKNTLITMIKFGTVGSCGALLNLLIYWISSSFFGFIYTLSSIIAFIFAVTFNYIFNHKWTFYNKIEGRKISLILYIKYVLVNIVGLGINLLTLNLLIFIGGIGVNLIGQMLGILLGMLCNFLLSNTLVFKRIKS